MIPKFVRNGSGQEELATEHLEEHNTSVRFVLKYIPTTVLQPIHSHDAKLKVVVGGYSVRFFGQ